MTMFGCPPPTLDTRIWYSVRGASDYFTSSSGAHIECHPSTRLAGSWFPIAVTLHWQFAFNTGLLTQALADSQG